MTKIKKPYNQPTLEMFPMEPFYLLDGSKNPSGYAIDNDDEDPENIIPIIEGPGPGDEDEVEID